MKKLLFGLLMISTLSFSQENVTITTKKSQIIYVDGEVEDVLKLVNSDDTKKRNIVYGESTDFFDFKNMKSFFKMGDREVSLDILKVEEKNGFLHVYCDDINMITKNKMITHIIININNDKNFPLMLYHFYWEHNDTTYVEITLD